MLTSIKFNSVWLMIVLESIPVWDGIWAGRAEGFERSKLSVSYTAINPG